MEKFTRSLLFALTRCSLLVSSTSINTLLQIQSSIDSLQVELNNSQSTIEDAQRYLSEHVTNFNGSVRITPATSVVYPSFPVVCPSGGGVSVIVDWKCIEAMAESYHQRALRANESGHANYTSIQNSYSMVSVRDVLFCLRSASCSGRAKTWFQKIIYRKHHLWKVLLSSFHSNGQTLGFHSQTQKLEPSCTA